MVLHVLGHVHLTRREETVPVSGKAAALLTYLCLEGLAHHREHLAELLWNTPDPLRNLRVELARLKRDDVAHFPERQPMLAFRAPLDLTDWLSAAQEVQGERLLPWLSKLRGLPLSGLEDLGSRRYQQWLEGQRWAIIEQVERTLGTVRQRLAGAGQQTQAGQIQARAEQLGLRLPNAIPDEAAPNAAGRHGAGMYGTGRQGNGMRENGIQGAGIYRTGMDRNGLSGPGTHRSGQNGVGPETADLYDPELKGAGPASAGEIGAEPRRSAPVQFTPAPFAPDLFAPDPATSDPSTPAGHGADAPPWECVWEEQHLLTRLMERSTSPQLLLLYGRGGSGKRTLLRQSVAGSGWHLIQLQASVQQSLFQEALAQQLSQMLSAQPDSGQLGSGQPSPGQPGAGRQGAATRATDGPPSGPPLSRPGRADDGLIDLASSLRRSGLRLVIAVHNALLGQSWLPGLARFLLDLPLPLILVLSETLPARLEAVAEQVAFVDAQRMTRLQMSPLSTQMVLRAWEQRRGEGLPGQPAGPGDHNQTLARAARLIQRSEGWPLHAQALYRQGLPQPTQSPSAQSSLAQSPSAEPREPFWPASQASLPGAVQTALLGEVAALPAEMRHQLARLSLIHTGFDRELAELLSAPTQQDGSQTLLYAAQQGLLVPAAGHEHALLPSLNYRSDDQTRWLQFGSEALRVALAGSLTGLERQAVRQTLARFFLDSRPALSLHYARKAGLADVVAQATQALKEQDAAAAQQGAEPPSELKPPPSGAIRAAAPAALAAFRRETRTPNGYRVALDSGQLEVMRHGCYGPPPLLTLAAGKVPAGEWSLTARTDVFRAAPELGARPAAYALGLRAGDGPRTVYTVQQTDDTVQADLEVGGRAGEDPAEVYGGCLPAGEWFTLRGVGGGGTLELSVRALDVALTVAELTWGGVRVLPVQG